MKVLINSDFTGKKRKEIRVELLKDRGPTVLVRLPDGNIITRKKNRDLPKEKSDGQNTTA